MRFSIAQLIVVVTVAAFLIAFGGFLLGTLERLFLPISVIGFLGFLIWSLCNAFVTWFGMVLTWPFQSIVATTQSASLSMHLQELQGN